MYIAFSLPVSIADDISGAVYPGVEGKSSRPHKLAILFLLVSSITFA